jgi:L-iditol 2-dehydrogenase
VSGLRVPWEILLPTADSNGFVIPKTMQAAVYRGASVVNVEEIPTPSIGPGEILIRVEACGICHTDLKKIEYNLLAPPRVFGHETAGIVVAVGSGVTKYALGDRVVAFHHIPCGHCFYCQRKLYAQCPVYKKVGITAGFEPAGGGFSQYVRVMDWIVEAGVEKIPEGVSFERATLVEPLNTCLKAVVQCDPQPEDLVVILGQGPIGLMFTMLVHRAVGNVAARVAVTDTIDARLELATQCGAEFAWDPRKVDVAAETRRLTGGRGADLVIVAASVPGIVDQAMACSRPGARILLFAQTSASERIETSGADLCVGERTLFGCYSASLDLQAESAKLVFGGEIPVEALISHRLPLVKICSGFDLALHPGPKSLKIIVQPQRWS